jgi:hypothetical protein
MGHVGSGPVGHAHGQGALAHAQGPANGPAPYGANAGRAPVPQAITPAGSAPHGWQPGGSYPAGAGGTNTRWVWFALGLLILGAVTGAVLAYAI